MQAPPAAFLVSSFHAMMMENTVEAVTPDRFATPMAKGLLPRGKSKPTSSIAFEWDGTVDDDAHLGFSEQ